MIILHGTPNDPNEIIHYDYDPYFYDSDDNLMVMDIVKIGFLRLQQLNQNLDISKSRLVRIFEYKHMPEYGKNSIHYRLLDMNINVNVRSDIE